MKKLSDMLSGLKTIHITGNSEVDVLGITANSHEVKRGDLFVAVKGLTVDGHEFIPQVIDVGASVIVGEAAPSDFNLKDVTYVQVDDTRKTLGKIASAWFDNPSKKLTVIGVTGTDGKTTTATLIYHLLSEAGLKAGLVSTVNAIIGSHKYDTGFHVTNPDPIPLQKYLAEMVKWKSQYAVLEVTSHGLEQHRVAGIDFKIGVLTNITHEHLDYHNAFENYIAAKGKLFTSVEVAVLNKNNTSADSIRPFVNPKAKIILYSPDNLSEKLKTAVNNRFLEGYNQENATAAIAVAQHIGISEEIITGAIQNFQNIVGRMELLSSNPSIYVDFAHTPNALENVLTTLKNRLLPHGKLIAVFGCAGERDLEKRPLMGEIATKIADISIFTAEDPRSEDINKIFGQMIDGVGRNESAHKYELIQDRREAIRRAIEVAGDDDIVVICGKGHEKSINLGRGEIPWSDQSTVKELLSLV